MVNRGKTCLKHEKRRQCCKECGDAEKIDKKQRFFGVKERAAMAAANPL
jgi:hypothetical protein